MDRSQIAYSNTASFMAHVGEKEEELHSLHQLMRILEKKSDERSFDELLVIRVEISKIPFLRAAMAPLPPAKVDQLCREIMLEYYLSNSIVFRQGDVGDKFYGKI